MSNLRVGDSISATFGLVSKNVGTYLGTQGVIILIAAAISLVYTLVIGNGMMNAMTTALETGDTAAVLEYLGPVVAGSFVFIIASVVLSTLSVSMGIVVSNALQNGTRLTFSEAWAQATPRFGNLLGTTVLMGLAAAGILLAGFLLFFLIVPVLIAIGFVIYLFARWAVATVVSVLETRRVTENFKRSSELTQGARGTIIGAFVILGLLIAFPIGLASVAASLGAGVDLDAAGDATVPQTLGYQISSWVINTLGQLAGSFLVGAFIVIAYRTLQPPSVPDTPVMPTPLGFDPVTDDA